MKLKMLAVASLFSLVSFTAVAVEAPNGPHVTTSGQGSVDVTPDMAILSISVSALSKEATEAKKEVDAGVAKYYEFLQAQGVDKKDIDAANIQIRPEYDYRSKTGEDNGPTFLGYRAERSVRVSLRELAKLNTVLDGALKAGLTGINGIELGSSKATEYQLAARKKAIADATLRAKSLAEGFDAKLGPVYSISYGAQTSAPMPRIMMGAAKMDSAMVEQTYEKSNITFTDSVDVVFDIQR